MSQNGSVGAVAGQGSAPGGQKHLGWEGSRVFLEDLGRTVRTSPALNNRFYNAWTTRPFPIEDVEVFARNYGEFVVAFPEVLATMIGATKNVAARVEYARTLFSEMGYGELRAAHSVLFEAFCVKLSERLGRPDYLSRERLVASRPLLKETVALIVGEKELYMGDAATGAGAQLALEWQAYTMLRKLYEGACQYRHLWEDADEFHGACEYFYAHIGAAEKDHKIEALRAAIEVDTDSGARARIVDGFERHLRLFAAFWDAIHGAIAAQREG